MTEEAEMGDIIGQLNFEGVAVSAIENDFKAAGEAIDPIEKGGNEPHLPGDEIWVVMKYVCVAVTHPEKYDKEGLATGKLERIHTWKAVPKTIRVTKALTRDEALAEPRSEGPTAA